MRNFLSVFFRFLLGWITVFFVLCIVSLVKYWDVLVRLLSTSVGSVAKAGFTIFLTIFVIVLLLRSIFTH